VSAAETHGQETTTVVTLDDSYRRCRELNRRHGTTYYWSTRLLPGPKRRYVHALYGFCRYADDIVDDLGPAPVAERDAALADLRERFFADLILEVDGHGPHRGALLDVRRLVGLHGRLGGGDR
jgi:phytoene/squalene synthetase